MPSREGDASLSGPDRLSELTGTELDRRESLDGRGAMSRESWLRRFVLGLDGVLCRCQSIVEYTSDPNCILRIRLSRLDGDVVLSDGTRGRAGDRIIDLHFWNEHIPRMPERGASIAWARQMHLCFRNSLRELARYLALRPDLDDVCIIRCNMGLGVPEQNTQVVRLIARYGFERLPGAAAATMGERVRCFGENILISLMVWVHNAAALRWDTLRRGRTQVFLSRRVLEQRYGHGVGRVGATSRQVQQVESGQSPER
jgi:hypothetical protein